MELKEMADRGRNDKKLAKAEILKLRRDHYGPNCLLFFSQDPLLIERARGQYLYDEEDNRYLDMVNNVAHVGHSHPRITEAATKQMEKLYTNNRYLHENLVNLAKRITETLPAKLSVCYFTNSGSEANDLALQMARMYSKQRDIITLDNAYHGTTTALQEINPYKWKQVDEETSSHYKPSTTHVVPAADPYRGEYRDSEYTEEELTDLYVKEVEKVIRKLREEGRSPAAFIAESMQSCGGQVIYPSRYLEKVQNLIRSCGGLVISDEIQTGFGRLGEKWWAFQHYNSEFVPDIMTLGKPMGNGHPIAAVITTKAVVERFKLPYFNTFGGNPVSCAIALEVMKIIDDEGLREHAIIVGDHIKRALRKMAEKHRFIGDVRGCGLFLGLDLVMDRETREPATSVAAYVVSKLKSERILISRDGPHENVIKFKPPMCITIDDADEVCQRIDEALTEADRKLQANEDLPIYKTESCLAAETEVEDQTE